MSNAGGVNLTSSPISIGDDQATGTSYNYDYAKTGAITKVLAPNALNTVADAQLNSLGLGMHHDVATDLRTLIRCAGTQIQTYNTSSGLRTSLSDDTSAANSNFLTSTNQPVVFSCFNASVGGTVLWMAGGGMSSIYGYTGPTGGQITANGVAAPTGSITTSVNTMSSGTFPTGGVSYYYAIQYRKKSTQAFSNVSLDSVATIVNTSDTVTLNWTLTNVDTTLYDQVWIWRSAVNGSTGFTTGSIIAQLPSSITTYTDTGPSIADTQLTARPGNTVLDNSPLPPGVYKYVCTFKRRLIAFSGSAIYLSDLNKPESWPLTNVIQIASGGPITGGSAIGNPSEYTTGTDEYLCIWKERELWALTGDDFNSWDLVFIDKTGCAGQNLVCTFNGYVAWMGYTGIFIWGGNGQPTRISLPIQVLWDVDGDIDKANLKFGTVAQYEKASQVIWRISHRTLGFNKFSIKLDTRLTSQSIASATVSTTDMNGIYMLDTDSKSYDAMVSFRPSNYDEMLIVGDNVGFVYQQYGSTNSPVLFDYETKPLDMGHPERQKRFKRVIVYVEKITPNDLKLYFWADYRVRAEYASVVKASLTPTKGTQPALWDVALWDQAYWDDYTADISPIEFHLHSYENNAEGISLKLRFEQYDANAPVRIHGYAIEWDDASNLPVPTAQI